MYRPTLATAAAGLLLPVLAFGQSLPVSDSALLSASWYPVDGGLMLDMYVTGATGPAVYLRGTMDPASDAGNWTIGNLFPVDANGELHLTAFVDADVIPQEGVHANVQALMLDAGQIVKTPTAALALGGTPLCERIDFDKTPLGVDTVAGEQILEQYAPIGLHISADNAQPGHPDKVIIFDSANPTGGDPDLATPGYHPTNTVALGNLLIIAENDIDDDDDMLVDDPDDEAKGGIIYMDFDEPVVFCTMTIVDVDGPSPTEARFYGDNGLIQTIPFPDLDDNSVEQLEFFVEGVTHVEIDLGGSGGVARIGLVLCPTTIDFDTTASGLELDLQVGEPITDQFQDSLGVTFSALNNKAGHPDICILFDTANPTGGDTDLATPGNGIGNDTAMHKVLIIAENDDGIDGDGLVDDPDDELKGGIIRAVFDLPVDFASATVLDIDGNEDASVMLYGAGDVLLMELPLSSLGNNSVETVEADVSGVLRIDLVLSGSGALGQLSFCPSDDDQPTQL